MQTAPTTTGSRARRIRPSGFTLMELVVTLAIMGVMIAMSAPRFGRSIEQSKADFAAANLRAIWAAQKMYWLENHAYAGDLPTLRTLGLLDPLLDPTTPTGDYTYTVTSSGSDNFQATATRVGGIDYLTLDQDGRPGGSITAGFQ
jgi:prepilin-type N-terminal cleavage/methylation domain-containing protein